MSNKYPQYFTTSGLERRKKKPSPSSKSKTAPIAHSEEKAVPAEPHFSGTAKEQKMQQVEPKKTTSSTSKMEISLVTTPAKKVDRKRKMIKRASDEPRTISPAAAKAIAEALKSMLHS